MNREATLSRSRDDHGYQSDDDLVVYGEPTNHGHDPGENPIEDAEETQMSQQTIGSERVDKSGAAWMSREERRKRRREWKERQVLDQHHHDEEIEFPELSDDEATDNAPMEDTFASLQALLEEKPTQQDSQHDDTAMETKNLIRPRTPEGHAHTSKADTERLQNRTDRSRTKYPVTMQCIPEPSPPDFAMNNDDFESDNDGDPCQFDNTKTKKRQQDIASVAIQRNRHCQEIVNTTKSKRKKGKSNAIRDQPTRRRSCSPESSSTSTHPNTRTKKQKQRHSIDTSELNGISSSCTNTHVTQTKRTIVGLRPTHWQRPKVAKVVQSRVSMSAELSAQHKKSRMNLLMTRGVHSRMDITTTPRVIAAPLYHKHVSDRIAKENISGSNQPSTSMQESDPFAITAEHLRSMRYHPPTMPKPRMTEELSTQKEHEDEPLCPVVTMNRPNYSSPVLPRRHSSSKSKGGAWTNRLSLIKSDENNNVMKLQHAGMCRHGVSFDLNDPRKKAKTSTDVTILSSIDSRGAAIESFIFRPNEAVPSSCDGSLITVSCFIHDHGPTNGNTGNTVTESLAWISFKQTTARNIGLEQGIQLRLYDAVLLPIHRSGSMKGTEDDKRDAEHRFVVICTQLCERHPTGLSPIPSVNNPK